jgi:hypothetical protein
VLIVGWIATAVTWYVGAAEQEYSPGAPGTEPLALAIAVMSGLTAGALFSVARDLRGSTTGLRKIMPLPILLAILVAFGGDTSDRSAFGDRLLSGLFVLLVTGLPLLSGYLVMRWLVAVHRSRRIELPPQNIRPLLFPELEAATDGARVVALLREYPLDNDGWDFLAVDQKALERAGYETIAISTEDDLGRDAQKMVVLFARKGVLPRPDA